MGRNVEIGLWLLEGRGGFDGRVSTARGCLRVGGIGGGDWVVTATLGFGSDVGVGMRREWGV